MDICDWKFARIFLAGKREIALVHGHEAESILLGRTNIGSVEYRVQRVYSRLYIAFCSRLYGITFASDSPSNYRTHDASVRFVDLLVVESS